MNEQELNPSLPDTVEFGLDPLISGLWLPYLHNEANKTLDFQGDEFKE